MVLPLRVINRFMKRTEGPEIDTYIHGQRILDKGERVISSKKGSLFNSWCWKKFNNLYAKAKYKYFDP